MTLYLFAFLSGVVTIFAPCIWPLLPIILSSGVTGGKKKPLGIIVGLSISFLFFTLALAALLKVVPIDPEIFRDLGIIIIIFLGFTLLIPKLTLLLEGFVSRLSARFGGVGSKQGSGFGSGVLTGAALGVVWSPCAGPILATVATIAATSGVNSTVFFIGLSFVVGVALPLALIAFLGQRVFARMRGANKYTARIQQVFGVIVILAGVIIYTGYDKTLQAKILAVCGIEDGFFSGFENNDIVKNKLQQLRGGTSKENAGKTVVGSNLKNFGPAPEFTEIAAWLNTENDQGLTMKEDLKGKVVLIDFWTYSCINCIRTFPYVKSWHEKYQAAGFTVVGVHTPEFLFEHKKSNVQETINKYQIPYPVAQDNEYGTWEAYQNRYWPAHYLIDAEGNIRYMHFGEGSYEKTEAAIQELLSEAGKEVESGFVQVEAEKAGSGEQTHETYLGISRMERFASTPNPTKVGPFTFVLPGRLLKNEWGYAGNWMLEQERSVASPGAQLQFQIHAKKVFLVMGPGQGSSKVEVWLDGNPIDQGAGKDVVNGMIDVTEERLYELVDMEELGEHTLELIFPTGNVAVYAFTFS